MKHHSSSGFTLIEVAIVFVIIAVLLSYTFMPLRAQLETANIKKAYAKLAEIEESLYGFAIANERLPCPTRPGNAGLSDPVNPPANCTSYIGFVPSASLGIKGDVNCDGLLVDPWGRPYMYSVTSVQSAGNGIFVTQGGIRIAGGPDAVNPDIRVCNDLSIDCSPGSGTASTTTAVAVIFSMGTRSRANSTDENENAGEATIASTCGLPTYAIGNDAQYYAAKRIEKPGQEFDDILTWLSPNILYARLLQAGYTISPGP